MTTIRIRSVITATASPRLFLNLAWIRSKIGHVATTIMVAHTIEVRNGLSIHKLAAISMAIKSTANVVLVMSRALRVVMLLFLPV